MKKTVLLIRAITIIGVLLTMVLNTSPALGASDTPPAIKTMKVQVWPEYDDPRVMVTYQGEFKDAAIFPQAVKFPAPLGSEMAMVCALKPPDDEHLCQLYDTLTEPNALAISYNLPIPTYYLEYYWDGIKTQTDKSFSFNYVSPYAVDSLEVEVQQPLKATDFKLVQPYASASSDALGMKYYRYVFNNVTPGQTISIDASYTKPDNKPSVTKKATVVPSSTDGYQFTFIATGAAVLVGVIILFVLLRRNRTPAPVMAAQARRAARIEAKRADVQRVQSQPLVRQASAKVARPSQPRTYQPEKARQVTGEAIFCIKCGTKLPAEAAFCHKCGATVVGAE